jgi:hypothetical protein
MPAVEPPGESMPRRMAETFGSLAAWRISLRSWAVLVPPKLGCCFISIPSTCTSATV